ncbi:MAG: glycosyltransferase [Patescibacteria group bacterium]|nr:MAG: glycosyltransferase [Patescibacteria group bacterium]
MRVAVLIPAHDEAAILEANAKRVWEWGKAAYGDGFTLVLSENGSHDSTAWVAKLLEKLLPGTIALGTNVAGKGGAIKRAAAAVEADVYLFMDADLSADLVSAERLIRAVAEGADCAIGSRRASDSEVGRPLVRKAVTRAYAAVANALLGLGVRDPQCGCKAFSVRVRNDALPTIRDDGFFFDTELLARLRQSQARIDEIGIRWTERPGAAGPSKVRLFSTGFHFLKKAAALRKELG